MLLPDNIHPEYSLYYNGSILIELLQVKNQQQLLDLYQEVKSVRDMSFSVFLLCLDWLYLIDVAVINNDGVVELCS